MLRLKINERRYGELFSKLRQENNFKAAEVAHNCNYSRSYICDLEKSRRMPTKEVLAGILKCYNIDYDTFITRVNSSLKNIQDALNDLIFLNSDSMRTLYKFVKEREYEISKFCVLDDEFYILDAIYCSYTKVESISKFKALESRIIDVANCDLKAMYYLYYGVAKRDKGEASEITRLFDLALENVKDQDVLSMIYYHYGAFEEMRSHSITAMQYNESALNIFIKSFNQKRVLYTQLHIANNFLRVKEFNKAKEIYIEMINKSKHNGMKIANATCISNLIWLYLLTKDYENAKDWFEHEDFDKQSINCKYMKLMYLTNTGQYEEAVALAEYVILNEKLDEESVLYRKFYCLYLKLDYPEKESTIEYYLATYQLMNENTDRHTVMIMLDLIVEFYETTRKYKHALHYSKIKALL